MSKPLRYAPLLAMTFAIIGGTSTAEAGKIRSTAERRHQAFGTTITKSQMSHRWSNAKPRRKCIDQTNLLRARLGVGNAAAVRNFIIRVPASRPKKRNDRTQE
jgi:hypothetical protein